MRIQQSYFSEQALDSDAVFAETDGGVASDDETTEASTSESQESSTSNSDAGPITNEPEDVFIVPDEPTVAEEAEAVTIPVDDFDLLRHGLHHR